MVYRTVLGLKRLTAPKWPQPTFWALLLHTILLHWRCGPANRPVKQLNSFSHLRGLGYLPSGSSGHISHYHPQLIFGRTQAQYATGQCFAPLACESSYCCPHFLKPRWLISVPCCIPKCSGAFQWCENLTRLHVSHVVI